MMLKIGNNVTNVLLMTRCRFILNSEKFFRFSDIRPDVKRQEELNIFFVNLCNDVFLDVLCYANRRRLVKLEKIGRRFLFVVNTFFEEKPFLCLDLILFPPTGKKRFTTFSIFVFNLQAYKANG